MMMLIMMIMTIMMMMIMIFSEAEADPRLVKVIKTVQIFDDEDQPGGLEDALLAEDADINGLHEEFKAKLTISKVVTLLLLSYNFSPQHSKG